MSREQLHTTRVDPPSAILVGLATQGDERSSGEALLELSQLADTAGFQVTGSLVQHRRTPDPNTYLGSGKVSELAGMVRQLGAKVVVADDPLGPTQARNMESALGVPVVDRSELILLIFGYHARTSQARLQVELAQLEYQLPRLKRMWTHLERQRGGIGVRGGAGEKQIDVDRSALRTRIAGIRRDLRGIQARRSRQIRSRGSLFSIALVGYTNAGKSTLMNRLTQAGVLAENRLFSTLDTLTRPWRLPGGRTVLVSDTVGFIRNLPHQLVASFHATLEEALQADLLFLVVDASSPEARQQMETVESVLEQLGAGAIPRIHVLNKVDALEDRSHLAGLYARSPKAVALSAATGEGLPELEKALLGHMSASERRAELLLPHALAGLQAEIRANVTVMAERYTEEGCILDCLVNPSFLEELLARGIRPVPPTPNAPDA
ncbi:MAG: GTPase HflX [Planctomycetes bacterium]|nr:GTPase HflX [Planctomycetota bacterium]